MRSAKPAGVVTVKPPSFLPLPKPSPRLQPRPSGTSPLPPNGSGGCAKASTHETRHPFQPCPGPHMAIPARTTMASPARTKISDRDAVRAIIGEGANQSDAALAGIASAIHNRGNLRGVYRHNATPWWTPPATRFGRGPGAHGTSPRTAWTPPPAANFSAVPLTCRGSTSTDSSP